MNRIRSARPESWEARRNKAHFLSTARPLADLFIFIMRFYLKAPLLTLLPDPRDDRTRGVVNEHLPRVIISRPFDCHVSALFQAAA
jgi:hypothetical protein